MTTNDLGTLTPTPLWKHFLALSRIPRGSKNEAAAASYVADQAARLGLAVRRDAAGNVVVTKPGTAGKEKAPVTVLQGHLDMVCEKNSGTPHDFTKDPIRLVRDGDFLKATGTTLGADNGIGVAAALALLESKDVAHPPLECLFTIDEETGLTGAFNLPNQLLAGTRMLNLDTEEEGAIYIGCAGGVDSILRTLVTLVSPGAGKTPFRIAVTGLRGGHSGVDIHEGRGNALKILARALGRAGSELRLELASIDGGSKRNAIPREAFATVFVSPEKVGRLREILAGVQAEGRAELGKVDPDLAVTLGPAPEAPEKAFSAPDAGRIVAFLHGCLHGPLAFSPDIPGLVQTSTNLAVIDTKGDGVTISTSQRSSVESAKLDAAAMVAALAMQAGLAVERSDGYPGWAPNVSSPLLAEAKRIHKVVFGAEPAVKAIHAGLECGIIGEKYPGMDMISFGPTIQNAHSPDERVSVPSVARFWTFLTAVLAAL